jgi:sugar O-acyltransferase (sialic acid O-acetyltransferase NeuD family)
MPLVSTESISSIVIAGAGGFGLELFDYLSDEAKSGGPAIAGFIDDNPSSGVPSRVGCPYLGRIGDFRPRSGQVVVVAIGSVRGRKAAFSKLWEIGAETPSYVASNSWVSSFATVGRGSVICPFSIINREAAVAEGCVVNVHCSVGHGATAGAFSVLSPYAALNGDAAIGSGCFLGTRSTIYPRISIGDDCVVDSHTGVRANANDRQMISSRGSYQVSALRIL